MRSLMLANVQFIGSSVSLLSEGSHTVDGYQPELHQASGYCGCSSPHQICKSILNCLLNELT